MKRAPLWLFAVAAAFLTTTPAPAAPEDDALVDKVRAAIDKGVTYLSGEKRQGNWEVGETTVAYPGGWTSLALLALLTSGVDPEKEIIQDGLKYLRTVTPNRTYVVGLQTMVYALAGQAQDRVRIKANVDWLLETRLPHGWSYGKIHDDGGGLSVDNSNTQYALLGLHEGLRAGIEVDPKALREVQELMTKKQNDGGWPYKFKPAMPPSMTMTTAGLCNLLITGMDLAVGKQVLDDKTGVAENCGRYDENLPAARALRWIGANFPAPLTPQAASGFGSAYYCLYGLERAGRLTGQRYFGGHDWYEAGCRLLVGLQKVDGHWEGLGSGREFDGSPIVATSFALLFLSKGRTPILISKLAYGEPDPLDAPAKDQKPRLSEWNNKRNDMRHLVEFCSREIFKKQPLAWQAFDVRQLSADNDEDRKKLAAELLPSPVVFVNGHNFAPKGKEEEILKHYLANGGFLFAEACCGEAAFDTSFRALMKRLFKDNELTPLPADHPVWNASGKFAVPPGSWPLEGIQHGCKWVVIYSPKPIAGWWEADQYKAGRGKLAFQMGANVIAYATGLEAPRPRLTQVAIPDDKREVIKRGYLKVAQLRHEGDWQPAPLAMRNLMAEARKLNLDVALGTTPVYPTDPKVLDYGFLYMHGRNAFTESKKDLKDLHFKLTSGGTLLADACCGSPTFDAAFRKFMATLFADDKLKLEPIPLTDDLYGKELNGVAIQAVRCRRDRAGGKGDPGYQAVSPSLEGIKYNGRWVVIYSRYDLGCAMEGNPSSDCLGHDPASAMRLAKAAVLYALKR